MKLYEPFDACFTGTKNLTTINHAVLFFFCAAPSAGRGMTSDVGDALRRRRQLLSKYTTFFRLVAGHHGEAPGRCKRFGNASDTRTIGQIRKVCSRHKYASKRVLLTLERYDVIRHVLSAGYRCSKGSLLLLLLLFHAEPPLTKSCTYNCSHHRWENKCCGPSTS